MCHSNGRLRWNRRVGGRGIRYRINNAITANYIIRANIARKWDCDWLLTIQHHRQRLQGTFKDTGVDRELLLIGVLFKGRYEGWAQGGKGRSPPSWCLLEINECATCGAIRQTWLARPARSMNWHRSLRELVLRQQ